MRYTYVFVFLYLFAKSGYGQIINDAIRKGDSLYNLKKYNDAFSWYSVAANKANDYATLQIGKMIYREEVNGIDFREAVQSFRRLKEKGNYEALSYLGLCYYYGFGIGKNIEEALMLFRAAEKKYDPIALSMLGRMHVNGILVNYDVDTAIAYFEKAILLRDVKSYTWLANIYRARFGKDKVNDTAYSNVLSEAGCKEGDSYSCIAMGNANHFGYGMPIDLQKAIHYYYGSAEDGNATAKFFLALIYGDTSSGFRNLSKANKLMFEAIAQAKDFELYNFANFYINGNAIKPDYQKAISLLNKTLVKEEPLSLILLASIYENGFGCNKNLDSAIYLYERAIYNKSAVAEFNLGKLYFYLDPPDTIKAEFYFKKALDNGIRYALFSLGVLCLKNGKYDRALDYLKQSVEYGHVDAMLGLSRLYSYKDWYGVNLSKAKTYAKMACDAGSNEGCKLLQSFE